MWTQKSACPSRTSITFSRSSNAKVRSFSREVKFSYLSGEKLWNLRRPRRRRRRLRHAFPVPFRLSAGVKSQVFHGRNIVRQRRGRNVREPTEEWGGREGRKGSGSRGEVVVEFKETPTIQGPPAPFGYKVQCEPAQSHRRSTKVFFFNYQFFKNSLYLDVVKSPGFLLQNNRKTGNISNYLLQRNATWEIKFCLRVFFNIRVDKHRWN